MTMWPALTIFFAVACVALHFWWRGRYQDCLAKGASQQSTLDQMRQEREQALFQMQAQQQALFNSLLEGLLVLDQNHRIKLVNQALLDLFHLTDGVHGQTIMEAFRMNALIDLVGKVRNEGQVRGYEMELPGLNGKFVEANAAVISGSNGKEDGMILVFHDLTRVKQLENTRKEFVANVSHELRTPLTLIKGYVETLLDGAKDDPALTSKFLQTVQKHTNRLTFLIEDLLTISRLESGQISLNFQEAQLKSVVDRVLDDLESRAAEKKIHLEDNVSPDLTIVADTDRLQQVLFNLVDNAIKYGYSNGKVRLGARSSGREQVEVWVQDEGPGIPPESKERIFERFYRVDRARSREAGGTGLGLSIVKHIIQSHAGEVWVESIVGKGSTFYFTLPTK